MSLVSNARMYAVTPQAKAAWQALFAWVGEKSGVPLAYLDHAPPAPLEALWERGDLGVGFMCGLPFALAAHKPNLLAAPVPSLPRYGGMPHYCTDLVVRADRPFTGLSDTFGGRMGWTAEHSQSGCNAVRYHVMRYAPDRPRSLFAEWVGPLITPRRVIEAVLAGEIDVGPLDSYVHDLLRRHEPGTAAMLRVVESTAMTAIPPLVAASEIAADTIERLRSALLSCDLEPTMAPVLDSLAIMRFAPINSSDAYNQLRLHAQQADALWSHGNG